MPASRSRAATGRPATRNTARAATTGSSGSPTTSTPPASRRRCATASSSSDCRRARKVVRDGSKSRRPDRAEIGMEWMDRPTSPARRAALFGRGNPASEASIREHEPRPGPEAGNCVYCARLSSPRSPRQRGSPPMPEQDRAPPPPRPDRPRPRARPVDLARQHQPRPAASGELRRWVEERALRHPEPRSSRRRSPSRATTTRGPGVDRPGRATPSTSSRGSPSRTSSSAATCSARSGGERRARRFRLPRSVSHLANDTEGTVTEARRLADVARDNLMIKVPATPEGIPAIQQLISDASTNVTLLFAVDAYEAVHQAYLAGLAPGSTAARTSRGSRASPASSSPDRRDRRPASGREARRRDPRRRPRPARGARCEGRDRERQAGLRALPRDPRRRSLGPFAEAGADPQRVLWASTA